jgi:hypothetical protein
MTPVTKDSVTMRPDAAVQRLDGRVQQSDKLHEVAVRLAGEFAPVLPVDMVSTVVTRACRDLAGEVPAESLPEFVYHAARQRLFEAVGADPVGGGIRRRPARGRAS